MVCSGYTTIVGVINTTIIIIFIRRMFVCFVSSDIGVCACSRQRASERYRIMSIVISRKTHDESLHRYVMTQQ